MESEKKINFLKVDLNALHSFLAVIDTGSNKAAAEILQKDASGISRDIAKLATQLDVPPLFTKKGKYGSMPTPHAIALSGPAREALNILDAAFNQGGKFNYRSSEHTFRIALSDHADLLLMPKISDYCTRRAPTISFETHNIRSFEKNDDTYNALSSGAFDLVIYDNVGSLPQLGSKLIARDKWVWVTRKDCNISRFDETKKDYVFVIPSDIPDLHRIIETLRKKGPYITCQTVMKVLNHIANIERGIGCIPASIANTYMDAFNLKIVEEDSNTPDTALCVFWRDGMHASPERHWLLNAIEVATASELDL
ncbi:MAG: LysR family transcriptional regulator [Pseudomonadales bacterium]|nr:LysR family transcriptional regulator [Pseudomonadales bacterium]